MKFESIEFKNIFAYGEKVQRIDYSDSGKLVLLRGQSGAGKSAILSLPILVLYGKLSKINKANIANRINKHGWVRGTIKKGLHTYIIEREFSPNSVRVWVDDNEIEFPGTPQAEEFIENEIQDIPLNAFTNLITISMKKFKSFLSMSPAERKQVVDEVFDVTIVNKICEKIKADSREIGNSINGDNATLFTHSQYLTNLNNALAKIQERNASPDAKEKIEANNAKVTDYNDKLTLFINKLNEIASLQQEIYSRYTTKQQELIKSQQNLKVIDEKIRLYSQSKCPTCATPFQGSQFEELKNKLLEAKQKTENNIKHAEREIAEVGTEYQTAVDNYNKVNNAIMQIRLEINNIQNENILLNEKMKNSGEHQEILECIEKTNVQIDALNKSITDKTQKLNDLKKLQVIYSIEGITKIIINNYLPILNHDIAENLVMLNFPYTLSFDEKFNPHLKDMGSDVQVETLSDGEQTRVDLVVLCSLFKLLKRKYPSINILTIDESISTLDPVNSGAVLSLLMDFAMEHDLNCFIVSHTDLFMDNFDEVIEVEKINGFSQLTKMDTVN